LITTGRFEVDVGTRLLLGEEKSNLIIFLAASLCQTRLQNQTCGNVSEPSCSQSLFLLDQAKAGSSQSLVDHAPTAFTKTGQLETLEVGSQRLMACIMTIKKPAELTELQAKPITSPGKRAKTLGGTEGDKDHMSQRFFTLHFSTFHIAAAQAPHPINFF
jgi:hypothetical protein